MSELILKESSIPSRWINVELMDVVNFKKGKKPKQLISVPKSGYLPYILVDELENKDIRNYAKHILRKRSIWEKRELLTHLRSKLVLKAKKITISL